MRVIRMECPNGKFVQCSYGTVNKHRAFRWNTCESLAVSESGEPAGKWQVFSETLPPPMANAMLYYDGRMYNQESACMMVVDGVVRVELSEEPYMTMCLSCWREPWADCGRH